MMSGAYKVEGSFWLQSTKFDQPMTEPVQATYLIHPPAWLLDNPAALNMSLKAMAELRHLLNVQGILRNTITATEETKAFYSRVIGEHENDIEVRSEWITWTPPNQQQTDDRTEQTPA